MSHRQNELKTKVVGSGLGMFNFYLKTFTTDSLSHCVCDIYIYTRAHILFF
jgi:hypothetical protein